MPGDRADAAAERLCGRWLHSHEEDTETEMVFRPADHPLPPSRGRAGFELRADGAMVEVGIAPADGPLLRGGRWRVEGGRLVLTPEDRAEPARSLEIVEAGADRLVVRRPR